MYLIIFNKPWRYCWENLPIYLGDPTDTDVGKVLKSAANYQDTDIAFDRYREEAIKSTMKGLDLPNQLDQSDDLMNIVMSRPL